MPENNIWLSGIMGLIVGDALGVPVEFESREKLKSFPIDSMIGYGTYNQPAGTWSDDSSMTMATIRSLLNGYNPDDIMQNFVKWYQNGTYTPYGELFDIGMSTEAAIQKYIESNNIRTCGSTNESDNGNGSLMRILPICIYCVSKKMNDRHAISFVHEISSLTHGHMRSKIACGLYYFLVKTIISNDYPLNQCLQYGIHLGFQYYKGVDLGELVNYKNIYDLEKFRNVDESEIKSSGYVIDSLEAAIWCLLNSSNYKECVLKAVNLGDDTDTIAAICGGLAGLYYGYDDIPIDWVESIPKNDWIKRMCWKMQHR